MAAAVPSLPPNFDQRLMGELHEAGRTLVLITHDTDVASAAGRVVGIRDGLLTENDRRYLESVR